MADSTTTNLALVQPEVGASTDTWGGKLNADLGTIDALFASTPAALTIAWGGTGSTSAAGARANIGCGSIATQNANAVTITGGSIDNTTIGASIAPVVHVSSLIFPDATTQISAAVTYTVGYLGASANVSLSPSYQELLVEGYAASGAITVTLYTPSGNMGRKVNITKIDGTANPVTIITPVNFISGAASQQLFRQWDTLTMMSDGNNWIIL